MALFQPTLPSRGATQADPRCRMGEEQFQPTLPSRGATRMFELVGKTYTISTHAPLAGSGPPQ